MDKLIYLVEWGIGSGMGLLILLGVLVIIRRKPEKKPDILNL
jgi:preprotein translocase subunit SecY